MFHKNIIKLFIAVMYYVQGKYVLGMYNAYDSFRFHITIQ